MAIRTLMNPSITNFDEACAQFKWKIPTHFNIAEAVCDRHGAHENQTAMIYEHENGDTAQYSFKQIMRSSNRLANALAAKGIAEGDRVALVLPQNIETAITHIALYKLKAIVVPLSGLFGPDAIKFRLKDSGAKMVITDGPHQEIIDSLSAELPKLTSILDINNKNSFWKLIDQASDQFLIPQTPADTPALLIYTSGTTGPPKGAVVAHRCLLGNLPGFELSHDFYPQQNDLFWTPADWAWTGGLLDALLPSWFYGKPILAYEGGKFDPDKSCHLLGKYRVRNAFIPPTALKMLRQIPNIDTHYTIDLRSIMSAGEALGAELYHWGKATLGIKINEMWGQTEFNYLAGSASAIMPSRPGSMGKAYPGHRVEVIDAEGYPLPQGETGELAAHTDDPVMFLGYWKNTDATQEKIVNGWWTTGDSAYEDEKGYLWFVGRNDDVINTAGHRVGPGEIEDVLLTHNAVAQVAVIGKPDELRGEIIKAFVMTKSGITEDQRLVDNLKQYVKMRLAAHEYPREIEFIDELPMTTTGKVRRVELRKREHPKQP